MARGPAKLCYIDVQITEPGMQCHGPKIDPANTINLAAGETIVGITEYTRPTGSMGSMLAHVARVWILSELTV